MTVRLEHRLCKECLWELGQFSTEKKKLEENLSLSAATWSEYIKKRGRLSFWKCPEIWQESMYICWNRGDSDNDGRKNTCNQGGDQCWHRLPREAGESPLGGAQDLTRNVSLHPNTIKCSLRRGLDLIRTGCPLQPKLFYESTNQFNF